MSKANEPSFPGLIASEWTERECDSDIVTKWDPCGGLTKREYFAGLAMQALCSTYTIGRGQEELFTATAESAVKYANALLAELDKNKDEDNET